MHLNATTIETFYRAFQELDFETMAAVYHPEATFTDPVFELKGDEIGDMWRMFCTSGDDLRVTFSDPAANASPELLDGRRGTRSSQRDGLFTMSSRLPSLSRTGWSSPTTTPSTSLPGHGRPSG